MPIFIEEIRGYEEQIARPVVMEVIRQLADRMHIPPNVVIRYIGNGSALAAVNTTLDKQQNPNRLPGDTHIVITVTETYDPDRALSNHIYRPEHAHVFKDTHLDVYMWPLKNRVKYTVNVKYVASDRTSAQTWYTNIKRKYSQGVTEYLHDVSYSYPIPHNHMYKLGKIYDIRQQVSPINEVVGAYLKRCFSKNMTVITNQIGNNSEFVIKEKQIRILGYCDFAENPPVPEKENDSGVHSISFNYNFDYDRVEQVVMAYPFMIHNQVVPEILRPPITFFGTEDVNANLSTLEVLHQQFSYDLNTAKTIQSIPGIPIPIFDDWLPNFKHRDMSNLLRIMLDVNLSNKHAVLDLNNLGDWALDPLVLDYLRDTPINHLKPYDSVINIALYKRHSLYDVSDLMMTNQLMVNTLTPLDETERYHLSIDTVNRLQSLTQTALINLGKHGYFAVLYLVTLYPGIAQIAGDYYTLPDGRVIFLGDPLTRPTCQFIAGYRIATIRMPDGDIIQSHLLPCMRDGEFTPSQLNELFIKLINKELVIPTGADGLNIGQRLVNTFAISTHRR
jgi:hypothetical protein